MAFAFKFAEALPKAVTPGDLRGCGRTALSLCLIRTSVGGSQAVSNRTSHRECPQVPLWPARCPLNLYKCSQPLLMKNTRICAVHGSQSYYRNVILCFSLQRESLMHCPVITNVRQHLCYIQNVNSSPCDICVVPVAASSSVLLWQEMCCVS